MSKALGLFSFKLQTGPPQECCLVSRPPVFVLSPIHSAAALKPKAQFSQSYLAAKMIAHISPDAAVKPETVKCESFGQPAGSHKYFSPPTFPSFVLVFVLICATRYAGSPDAIGDRFPCAVAGFTLFLL